MVSICIVSYFTFSSAFSYPITAIRSQPKYAETTAHPVEIDNERFNSLLWNDAETKKLFPSVLLLSIFATGSATCLPLLSSKLIALLTAPTLIVQKVYKVIALLFLFQVSEALFTFLYIKKSIAFINSSISNLQRRVFDSILQKKIPYFDNNRPETLTALATTEIDQLKSLAFQNLSKDRGLRSFFEIICLITTLIYLSPTIGILYAIMTPIISWILSQLGIDLKRTIINKSIFETNLITHTQEVISNFREVFTFNNQDLEKKRFINLQKNIIKASLEFGHVRALTEAGNRLGIYIIVMLTNVIGTFLVAKKFLSPNVLLASIYFAFSLIFAMQVSGISFLFIL